MNVNASACSLETADIDGQCVKTAGMAKKKKAAKKAAAPAKAPAPAPAREFPLRPACTMETSLGSFTFELLPIGYLSDPHAPL